jgi:hypothetical protein
MEASITTRMPVDRLQYRGLVREMRNVLPKNGGVDGEKVIDGLACLQKVDERLHGHSRVSKAGRSVHDLLVDGHHARKRALLLCRHRFFNDRGSATMGQIIRGRSGR